MPLSPHSLLFSCQVFLLKFRRLSGWADSADEKMAPLWGDAVKKHLRALPNMCVIKTWKYCSAKHLLYHPSWSFKGTAVLIAQPNFTLCSCEFNEQFAFKIFGKCERRTFAGHILNSGLFTRTGFYLSKIGFLSTTQKIKLQSSPVSGLSSVWCCVSTAVQSWIFLSRFSIRLKHLTPASLLDWSRRKHSTSIDKSATGTSHAWIVCHISSVLTDLIARQNAARLVGSNNNELKYIG